MTIKVKFWYSEVTENFPESLDKIIEAIDYWRDVLNDGQSHLDLKGYLLKLLQEQPGLLRIYGDAHTDCAMIWKWLDETIKHEKAKKRLWYQSAEGKVLYGDLKKTDIDVYIQSDTEIKSLIDLQLAVELWKESLNNLVDQLKSRGITLAVISKVRESGQHEAFIDSSKETNPETLS
jgi:hypothetical protein